MTAQPPTVVGPIVGAQPPWGVPSIDLGPLGYVVEEFWLDGTLRGHQLRAGTEAGVDGHWEVEPYGDAPYRTRLLVDRAMFTARWCDAVDRLVADGALRPEDAPAMKARAADVGLPVE